LNQIDPSARNQIVHKLSEQYSNDTTEDKILSRARNMLFKELQSYLARASDSAVLDNIDIIIAYMEGLLNTDPERCISLVDETKGAKLNVNLARQFRDIFRMELDLHANILRDAKKEGVKAPTERQVQPYLSKVFFALGSMPGVRLSLLDQPNLGPSDYKDYCGMTLSMFREIRRLPREEAVALLRYLYSLGKR
jgi:hypothetical protein